MAERERIERIVTTDFLETIWLRFSRLTSTTLAKQVISARAPDLDADALQKKAEGVVSAVGSALGYWRTPTTSLGARILTRYYALLQASIAEQVAGPDPRLDLAEVQRHTELGHGLKVIQESDKFPHDMYVYAVTGGHFASYAKSRGLSINEIAVKNRLKVWQDVTEADRPKLISVADLLLRVPEMQLLAPECLRKRQLSFRIAHAQDFSKVLKVMPVGGKKTTRGLILIEPSETVTVEWLKGLGLPFANIEAVTEVRKYESPHFVGEIEHPAEDLWWNHFEYYESDHTGKSIISPFWGTADALILHLVTLYALSIVVRYLPSLWQRVERGDLDHIRALLEGYMSEFDHIGSAMALERITGRKLILTQPGTFGAPI